MDTEETSPDSVSRADLAILYDNLLFFLLPGSLGQTNSGAPERAFLSEVASSSARNMGLAK